MEGRAAALIDPDPLNQLMIVNRSCPMLQYSYKSNGPPHALMFEVRVFYPLLKKNYLAIGLSKESAKLNVAQLIFEDLVTAERKGQLRFSKQAFHTTQTPPKRLQLCLQSPNTKVKVQSRQTSVVVPAAAAPSIPKRPEQHWLNPPNTKFEVESRQISALVPTVKPTAVWAFPGYTSFEGPLAKKSKPDGFAVGNEEPDKVQNLKAAKIVQLSRKVIQPLREQPSASKTTNAFKKVNINTTPTPTTLTLAKPSPVPLDEPESSVYESTSFSDPDPYDQSNEYLNGRYGTDSEVNEHVEASVRRKNNPSWFSVTDLEQWNPTDGPSEAQLYDRPLAFNRNLDFSSELNQVYPPYTPPLQTQLIPRDREMVFLGPNRVPFVRKHFVPEQRTLGSHESSISDQTSDKDSSSASEEPFNINPLALELITKMGWSHGRGLGKCNQGRIEPLQPAVRPSKEANAGLGFRLF